MADDPLRAGRENICSLLATILGKGGQAGDGKKGSWLGVGTVSEVDPPPAARVRLKEASTCPRWVSRKFSSRPGAS